jgi:hypothetical protein
MTNQEAINKLEELVIKQARIGLYKREVEAIQHGIEALKLFEKLNHIGNNCGHAHCYADKSLKIFEVNESA